MQATGDSFYKTKRWLELRKKILRRDKYTDQLDKRMGVYREAEMVHHILPKEIYPQYQWEAWNLISLSHENHELLHNRLTNELTNAGKALMMETAKKQGIKLYTLTLVVGLHGTGKTEYVRQHLGNGIAYDLDCIAGAFRLRGAHEEYHSTSRMLANSIGRAFAERAKEVGGDIFVIRTAPTIDELVAYDPDALVVCKKQYDVRSRKDYQKRDEAEKAKRIEALIQYAEANKIPLNVLT